MGILREDLEKMAEKHALDTYLCEYPKDVEYNEILERISEGNLQGILIWELLEGCSPAKITGYIEDLKNSSEVLIKEASAIILKDVLSNVTKK